MEEPGPWAVELTGITKRYGDLVANDGVDLSVRRGSIHALLGENGAGKSTLMNILYGMVRPDSGTITVDGIERVFSSPADAIAARVGMVHQHFMIAPSMTVAENVLAGAFPRRFRLLDRSRGYREVEETAQRFGFMVNPRARAGDLSVGELQRVEIVKALVRGASILVLDEPTAVLTPQEVDELSDRLRALAAGGVSIVLITHKLREVLSTCDRSTVMRGGRVVGSLETAGTDAKMLTEMMVGRLPTSTWHRGGAPGEPVMVVKGVNVLDDRGAKAVNAVDLAVRAGQIVGVAGVEGNGQSQLVEALTGLRRVESGSVTVAGRDVTNASPRAVRDAGLGHIPEDRVKRGVAAAASVRDNTILGVHRRPPHARWGVMRERRSTAYARRLIDDFAIAVQGPLTPVGTLSGGNMQKVVVARELATSPRVVVAAQPTRGVDVGSIEFIHRQLVTLRDAGVGILLVSAELEELLALSDVLHVMYEGSLVATFDPGAVTEQELGAAMAGHVTENPSPPAGP